MCVSLCVSLCVSRAPGPRPRPRPGVPERKGQDALLRFLGDLTPAPLGFLCGGGGGGSHQSAELVLPPGGGAHGRTPAEVIIDLITESAAKASG